MNQQHIYWINNNSIIQDFYNHIEPVNNNRILFSGPFGTGKSTFLKEFFEANLDKYNVITLNPINYSVSSNEDIFELIKYDIITQLLENYSSDLSLKSEDFSNLEVIQSFVKTKMDFYRLTKSFIKAFVPGTDGLVDFVNELKQESENLIAYKEAINRSDEDKLKDYLKQFGDIKGSMYERDEFSILIKDYIDRIRKKINDNEEGKEKEFVLLVDDLDRLDPEHLFRLFNIFSAHYNNDYSQNKFSFDKIVFVCDAGNVHKIFANRYGQDVQFSGYIDKFYSTQIYQFDNRKYLNSLIFEIAKAKFIPPSNAIYIDSYEVAGRSAFYTAFELIANGLISNNLLTIRGFQHLSVFGAAAGTFTPATSLNLRYQRIDYPFLGLLSNLRQLYPSVNNLLHAIESIDYNPELFKAVYDAYQIETIEKRILRYIFPFLVDTQTAFGQRDRIITDAAYTFKSKRLGRDVQIHYRVTNGYENNTTFEYTDNSGGNNKMVNFNLFEVIGIATANCIKRGWIS